jgi:membrane associated rhomboid family serine protease
MVPNLIVRNKEYYRIVSSGFTHINGTHLLLNGFAMFSFGPPLMQFLIDAYGFTAPVLFVIFYLLSISFADLPDLIRHRRNAEYS